MNLRQLLYHKEPRSSMLKKFYLNLTQHFTKAVIISPYSCAVRKGGAVLIYLVEDDENIRELVVYALNSAGMEAEGFATPSQFWKRMDVCKPKLVMLDIMLPEQDGLDILKQLRSRSEYKRLPVIMLSAKGTEAEKVKGLELGADDYIPKPFGMTELIARVKALLRRTEGDEEKSTAKEYRIRNLYVAPKKHIVEVDGVSVPLTKKEFGMLTYLLENLGDVLTRDQLLNQIWGYSFDGESRTVDVHIRTLRQKLGTAGDLVETVRGIGYKIDHD